MEKDKLAVLKKVLVQNKEIDYWVIAKIIEKKYNLYLTKNIQHENYLTGTREDYIVTVFKKYEQELGEATITIVDFGESEIKKKVDEALFAASLSRNPFYEPFAEREKITKLNLHDTIFDKSREDIQKTVEDFSEKIRAEVQKNKQIKFTSAEILTVDRNSVLMTSKCHELKQRKSAVYVELILTTTGKGEEVEFLADKTETTFEKFNISDFVKEAVETVIDISNAGHSEAFTGPVILTNPAIHEFFVPTMGENPIIINSSARAKYMNVSKFELGKPIAKFKGEKLTLKGNALIPQGLRSSAFDASCVPARNLTIVEDGILKNLVGAKQFADYLKIKPTGPLGNIQISPGKLSTDALYEGKTPVIEVKSFSWFDPSPYASDFASEIRLGYLIKDGKRIPFKGGLLVGSVFDAIADANYSKETVEDAGYYGPKAVRFNKLVVSGL
jgi:predicted Zn-dependent protease